MGNRWVAVLDRWLHEVAGLWGAGDYTLYRLGWDLCILAVIGRWLQQFLQDTKISMKRLHTQ